jgi:hypothetical protein
MICTWAVMKMEKWNWKQGTVPFIPVVLILKPTQRSYFVWSHLWSKDLCTEISFLIGGKWICVYLYQQFKSVIISLNENENLLKTIKTVHKLYFQKMVCWIFFTIVIKNLPHFSWGLIHIFESSRLSLILLFYSDGKRLQLFSRK